MYALVCGCRVLNAACACDVGKPKGLALHRMEVAALASLSLLHVLNFWLLPCS